MKKRIILGLFVLLLLLSVASCGTKDDDNDRDNNRTHEKRSSRKKEKEKEKAKEEDNKIIEDDDIIIDDEIIDVDDEDNQPPANDVTVKEVINCDGCVFAYFSGEGTEAKNIGDSITPDEYTSDIKTLKTSGGKQRHNFFGLVLNGNSIARAYACALKDDRIYCIEGSTNGAYHQSNIAILNQIFTADQCKTLSDGHNYWCSDGSYNGNSKTSGYTAMHYETSCTIYGADSNTGKLICH
jgi:hypothetical protein